MLTVCSSIIMFKYLTRLTILAAKQDLYLTSLGETRRKKEVIPQTLFFVFRNYFYIVRSSLLIYNILIHPFLL